MIKVPNLHFPHLALGTAAVWGTSCMNKVGPNGQTKHQSKAAATCCFCFWKTTWLMNPADETIWVTPHNFFVNLVCLIAEITVGFITSVAAKGGKVTGGTIEYSGIWRYSPARYHHMSIFSIGS